MITPVVWSKLPIITPVELFITPYGDIHTKMYNLYHTRNLTIKTGNRKVTILETEPVDRNLVSLVHTTILAPELAGVLFHVRLG